MKTLVKLQIKLTIAIMIGSVLTIVACEETDQEWRYEIRGRVKVGPRYHPAVWYTDSIELVGDRIRYQNSDSSVVLIDPPFILIDNTRE
jgi:hypothetical protein